MAKVRVAIIGTISKSVQIDTDPPKIGLNLQLPDGSVPTLAQLATALGVAPAGSGGSGSSGTTAHRLLSGLTLGDDHPQYTRKDTLTTRGDLYTRGAATVQRLALGASGAYFRAGATDPAWQAPGALTKTDDTNVTLTLGGSASTALLNAASLTLGWTGQLAVSRGGSGAATLTGYLKGTGTTPFTASATIPAGDISGGAALTRVDDTNVTLTLGGTPTTALLAAASITVGWSGTLAVARGGTGNSALAALTKTDDTNVTLTLGGSPTTALVNAASITVGWTGTLGVARGGTDLASYTAGDIIYATGATTLAKLAIGATNKVLTVVAGAPAWADVPAASGAALTKTDDTNVTLTLGGSPTTALVNAASVTVGWTGTLANSRGGTGTGTYTTGDILYASASNVLSKRTIGSTGDVLTVAGGVPTWAAPAGSVSGANPSASVGLAAVNGSATTYLRSDGAPALSQSITPTWTGKHIFGVNATGIVAADAYLIWQDSAGTADKRRSGIQQSGLGTSWTLLNDADSLRADIMLAARVNSTTPAVESIAIGNATDKPKIYAQSLNILQNSVTDSTFISSSRAVTKLNGPSGGDVLLDFTVNEATQGYVYASSSTFRINSYTNKPIDFFTNNVQTAALSGAGAWRWHAYGAGALTTDASGNITATSDARIKKNVRPFTRGLEAIDALKPVLYGYTKMCGLDQTKNDYVGFIAQDLQAVIPEGVGVMGDGMLTINDRAILAALVNAVQAMKVKLDKVAK